MVSKELENDKSLTQKWYIINTYKGQEDKAKEDLELRIKTLNMDNFIFDVRIVKDESGPKKSRKNTNVYAGYIFINMIMNKDAWFVVRNTPGVTGFVGSSGKGALPNPLTEKEVKRILHLTTKKEKDQKAKEKIYTADFKVNDIVKFSLESFPDSEGKVIKMDYSKGMATVEVEFFGQKTPLEIGFEFCKKVVY